jgi:hypothetical protein
VTAACLLAVCAAAPGRAATGAGLQVIPFPGTPDAPTSSPVIFMALPQPELRSVTVTGSRSGGHAGRLSVLPGGGGTAFVPDRAFTPGETVRVSATLSSRQAGAAEGSLGGTHLSYSFQVVHPVAARRLGLASSARYLQAPAWIASTDHGPTQSFHSEPDLHPPAIAASPDPDHGSGDIFAGIMNGPQFGPMILNPRGQVVWFLPNHSAANFEVQRYQGKPVLTWHQGVVPPPSEDVVMNRAYRTVAVVRGADGLAPDAHDFVITPQGTAFLSTVQVTSADLSSLGGPSNGTVIDGVVQEVDVKTDKLLWEWHSLGHVALSASYSPVTHKSWPPYDYFHLNSVQQLPDGNLLISARNTWAVYEISRKTGKVIWTLGGKYSNFKMGRGTRFEWQHDPRLYGHTLSLFDDADTPQEESQSSAKLLHLGTHTHTVSLIRRFTHSPPLLSSEMGSVQTLANHDVFVGWGDEPYFSQYSPSGRQIFNASAALGVIFYRAFRFPWVGWPRTRPSLAVTRTGAHTTLYASWNGATQVRAWRALGGSGPHKLKWLGVTSRRTGFETTIRGVSRAHYLAVQALNGQGKVLGTSATKRR